MYTVFYCKNLGVFAKYEDAYKLYLSTPIESGFALRLVDNDDGEDVEYAYNATSEIIEGGL